MSATILDFDRGLRALRSASKVHAVMARRRNNARLDAANSYSPTPPNGGSPVAMRQALAA